MSERDKFDITAQQYHAAVDLMWKVLGNPKYPTEGGVFIMVVKRILELEAEVKSLRGILGGRPVEGRSPNEGTNDSPASIGTDGLPWTYERFVETGIRRMSMAAGYARKAEEDRKIVEAQQEKE